MIKRVIVVYPLWRENGSSGFWSDKFCHLRLGLWGNVTRRKGEYGGLLKQSNKSHGGTVGAQGNGACLPILLAIYIQSVYPKIVIKNLYATPLSLFVPSAPPLHCITSVPSVPLCAYYIRLLVYHSIFRNNQKNKMYHNCENTSKILTIKNESASETLFLTFIIISLFFYNERNPQNESSCHSCHKRIAYNLLICSTFTWSVKSDSKIK